MLQTASEELQKKLMDVLPELTQKPYEVKYLIKKLRWARRTIFRHYRSIVSYNKISSAELTVADNYQAFDKAAGVLIRSFRHVLLPSVGRHKMPDWYRFIKPAVTAPDFTLTTDSVLELCDIFERFRPLTNAEFDHLTAILKSAAIISAAETIRNASLMEDPSYIKRITENFYAVDDVDNDTILKKRNRLERILANDPAGIYPMQDESSRSRYRRHVAKAAFLTNTDELRLAETLLQEAKDKAKEHIGFPIRDYYEKVRPKNPIFAAYFQFLFLTPALFSLFLGGLCQNLFWAFLFYFPLYEICRPILERLALKGSEVTYAPRLEVSNTVAKENQTLIALSVLLPKDGKLDGLFSHLKELLGSCPEGHVGVCLLGDLPPSKEKLEDNDRETLTALSEGVERLNAAYNDRLVCLVRPRCFSKTGQEYGGWERKRGAITALVETIFQNPQEMILQCGNLSLIPSTRYLLTLDADTDLTMECLPKLLAIASHPMNRPVIDKLHGVVGSGYGILAPRVVPDLKSSMRTPFARVFCGAGGVSNYDVSCSEFYQDLFKQSIFSGKGLIDVSCYHALLPHLFEEETILSHDVLEGGILRTMFVGDAELTDSFPKDASSYFKRLHRWIRGDFQNTPFLFPTVPLYVGKADNPFSPFCRFLLFDNLRRAFIPVFSLLLFLTAFFCRPIGFLITAGLLSLIFPDIYAIWRMLISGAFSSLARRFYSGICPKSVELLTRSACSVLLLPKFAYLSLDGAVRGLWRRYVSHRKMLEWTTAAQTELGKNQKGSLFFGYLPQWIIGGFLFVLFTKTSLCFFVFFFLAPFLLNRMEQKKEKTTEFSKKEREKLQTDIQKMVSFYDDYAACADHYLPPDNMQVSPAYRVAHRTSPTNIGLMLLSYLTARDCSLITTKQLYDTVGNTISTIEALPKLYGNLYNWYDTKTLSILHPAFLSTVDSGNFVCCLTALYEGLLDYQKEAGADPSLPKRVKALIDDTDLSVFYDKTRALFSIGWDCEKQRLSASHYDMLMSEARMTSYYAIAAYQVPVRHWRSLSRAMSSCGLHAGPLSWTGTMFEYFMPELLLPSEKGSISYEALEYCLNCQKKRAKMQNVPWGVSESGVYSFDAELCYHYSANGIQRLALKRGMDDSYVASPYAVYLTLSHDKKGAVSNLERLEEMGCYSKYGFYEAVDFTRERIGESSYEIVKSFMAHHVGMSCVAAGNALNDGIMQKRFLRNQQMRRAKSLLLEKIPVGEFIFEEWGKKKRWEFPRRKSDEYEYVGPLSCAEPRVKLLSNADMTSVLLDSGASYLRRSRCDLTRRPSDLLLAPVGTFAFVQSSAGVFPLTYAPSYRTDVLYETAFSQSGVLYNAQSRKWIAQTEVRLHRNLPVEERSITIKNRFGTFSEMTLLLYVEPLLRKKADDDAHKAFSKLFLNVSYDAENNVVFAVRRKRNDEETFVLAMGFAEDVSYDLIPSRSDVFERMNVKSPRPEIFTMPKERFAAGLPDPCAAFRVRFNLARSGMHTFTFLTASGRTKEEAMSAFLAVKEGGEISESEAARERLIYGSLAYRAEQAMLPQILFSKKAQHSILTAASKNTLARPSLWRFGISGDFPIVLCEINSAKDTSLADDYASCHAALRLSFVEFDLIFLYGGAPDTLQMLKTRIAEKCGESVLHMRAGIHILNRNEMTPQEKELFYTLSCHIAPQTQRHEKHKPAPYRFLKIQPAERVNMPETPEVSVWNGAFCKDRFYVTKTPDVPWCHVLANSTFGTLLTDRSLGFTWALNSRENKLTPWYNDPVFDNPSERLLLKDGGECFDLINGSLPIFSPREARYSGKAGDLLSDVSVFVPAKGMIKYIDVTLQNQSDTEKEITLCYYTEPCLDVSRRAPLRLTCRRFDTAVVISNPLHAEVPSYMALCANGEEFFTSFDRPSFFAGAWQQENTLPTWDPCAALSVKKTLPPRKKVTVRFLMSFSVTEKGALKLLSIKPKEEFHFENSIKVKSSDPSLDVLFNTWLPWQTLGSRFFARTGFYQNGGAYGFRDQLQDACALIFLSPSLVKVHLLRCCAVQFEEGDVMHWWHVLPKSSCGTRGVRTHYSDDMLWLPYAVCRYVEITGDRSVLEIKVPYLKAEELSENQKDNYIRAEYSTLSESVFSHCLRALSRALQKGEHGLLKMGGGDWNDGYNKVAGESVWLTEFMILLLKKMIPLLEERNDTERKSFYLETIDELTDAIDKWGWDGEWYLRAYYKDGSPMGTKEQPECQIDSLSQSFAVFAQLPQKSRTDKALQNAIRLLTDPQFRLIRLFTPPFANGEQDPGYIKAYPEGIRENGGQYTHAAVWLAKAACKNDMPDLFFTLTDLLNPIKRCQNPELARIFALEPYWMPADIWTSPALYGRGGWTMYTGSAGWYYQLLAEDLFGLKVKNGKAAMIPCLPDRLAGAQMNARLFQKKYRFLAEDPSLKKEEPPEKQ